MAPHLSLTAVALLLPCLQSGPSPAPPQLGAAARLQRRRQHLHRARRRQNASSPIGNGRRSGPVARRRLCRLYAAGARPQRARLRSQPGLHRRRPGPTSCARSMPTAATTGSCSKAARATPSAQLCDFRSKQFSSDGKRLYFLTPGWATSGALHVYELRSARAAFRAAGQRLLVLNFCTEQIPGRSRRLSSTAISVFGGSYDWYWLYDAAGKKELGPVGHFDNPDAMVQGGARRCGAKQAHGRLERLDFTARRTAPPARCR